MRVYNQFDLTSYNSYRIKATCDVAYFPESEEDLIELFSKSNDYILIGSGHNLIFSKAHYETPFIIFNGNFECYDLDVQHHIIAAESGITMLQLSELAQENAWSGLEIFYDIPSSLGGAVVMNAGASGEEIKDVLLKVRYLDFSDLTIKEILKEDMGFTYRNSFFQRQTDKIVLKVWLQLKPADKQSVRDKMETIKTQRWAKQPKDLPNAGSVFKRPPGFYVGALMDELQLKGFTVGGAKISEKHGGFIVNFNNATGQDILDIIQHAQKAVKDRHGVDLEIEQRII
uniref:UDP-N-acetylmuramate dehydrogenase n=1 Tax=Flavobacterium sp. TaxID=239 RepID=UPI00404B8138